MVRVGAPSAAAGYSTAMIWPMPGRLPSVSLSERYELRSASDPIRWDLLVDQSPTGYFSQLWEWGEIQRSIDWEPWRLELLPVDGEGAAPIAARHQTALNRTACGASVQRCLESNRESAAKSIDSPST
jgi:hypothetical protein